MDRPIAKKTWTVRRIAMIIGLMAIATLIYMAVKSSTGKKRLNVNPERITISEVQRGPFQDFIPVNGIVMPLTTIYLDAVEGGRVEERFVEDGAMMKRGQPIIRLENTDLELSLANQETAVFEVLTQMQNTRNNAVQNTIRQLNQMAEVENALEEARRVYELNKKLYAEKVIGSQEYKSSENLYNYQIRRRDLTAKTLEQDSITMDQQLTQMAESYNRMQNALRLMRRKVEDLIVRAPVDGQLTSLDAEFGQTKTKGERLGQIDVTSGYKVRADIDEYYIARIYTGLAGTFSFAGAGYKLVIKKIYTQVVNGRFQVDMEFEGEVPNNIRRGQNLQIRVALSDETEAILLAKGGFFQQTTGNWVFKVGENGQAAYRVDIQINRQSPEYYEVTSGLQPGDKVITSSYENYQGMDELIFKK